MEISNTKTCTNNKTTSKRLQKSVFCQHLLLNVWNDEDNMTYVATWQIMQQDKMLVISTKTRMIATYTLIQKTVCFIGLFVISARQSFPIIRTIDSSVLRIGSQWEYLHSLQTISQCIKDLSVILLVMNCDSTLTSRKNKNSRNIGNKRFRINIHFPKPVLLLFVM